MFHASISVSLLKEVPKKCDLRYAVTVAGTAVDRRTSSPPPPAPAPHRDNRPFPQQASGTPNIGGVEATIKDIRMTLQRTKTLPLRPLCVTNGGDNEDRESTTSNKSETPIWVPR